MKKSNSIQNVVIYGDSDLAEEVLHELESDGRYKIVAFTVDESKYNKKYFNDLPIIKFQSLKDCFSNEDVLIFPAIGYSKSNTIREIVLHEIEDSGYRLLTYISRYAFIGPHVRVGKGSYISHFTSIGAKAIIGDGVIIKMNCSISHDVIINNYCYLPSAVTIGGGAIIRNNTFLGLNSTIKNGIEIAEYNIIGSAANVVKSTTANGLYVGNPARRIKDVDLNNVKI